MISFFTMPSLHHSFKTTKMKSVIITGATSGIGYECALHMAKIATQEQIVIACRNQKSGEGVIQNIKQKTGHQNIICLPLDLESLQSAKDFANQFSKQPDNQIIALINNAGGQNVGETRWTKDGFESTFGLNHLAPFYLTLLLLPLMDNNGSIIFTASGVHDPLQKTGVEPPVFKPAKELAFPTETGEKRNIVGLRRYSTSKLCNVLTTYELQRRLANTNIRVNAFDPGLVPGTGLARTYPPLLKFAWKNIMPVLRLFIHNVNTAQNSGKRLANLAYADEYKSYRGKYFEGTKEIKSSKDSYNQEFQNTLWKTSVELVGIKQNETSANLLW
jgi:NAD(P)-dependent dehydrogenase (short-subunit alcohol dehydrogenase family)